MPAVSHEFNGLLAREMLYIEAEDKHAGQAFLQFLLQTLPVAWIVSVAQQTGSYKALRLVLDDTDATEGYDASVMRGVVFRLDQVLFDDAEARLVAGPDGIHLVTRQSAVEIEPPFGPDIAQGNGIGIAAVTQQSQGARRGPTQYFDAFPGGELLALAPHYTEFHIQD